MLSALRRAPWCGWCHKLEGWMARPEVAALLGKAFVDLKIDTDRMVGGGEMLAAARAHLDPQDVEALLASLVRLREEDEARRKAAEAATKQPK